MRITHNMMTRNYLSHMNNNLRNLTKSNDKLASQRSFNKASENVGSANRALRVRKLLEDNERSTDNIRDLKGSYSAVEDGLRSINKIIQNTTDRTIEGMNGTISVEEKGIIAREISNLQEEIFQISNASYNDKFLFASSGNSTGTAPFTTGANGKLYYNGINVPVDEMIAGPKGQPMIEVVDPVTGNTSLEEIPYNIDNYLDIGLGFEVGAAVDPRTAVKSTFSGVEIFGFGTNEDGLPNNLYSLLGKMSEDMAAGKLDDLQKDLDHMKTCQDRLLMNITDVGNLSSFADQIQENIDNDTLNLQSIQNSLEAVDLSEEIMYNKDYEMAWMVTLQLGSKVLPSTIFDFIR